MNINLYSGLWSDYSTQTSSTMAMNCYGNSICCRMTSQTQVRSTILNIWSEHLKVLRNLHIWKGLKAHTTDHRIYRKIYILRIIFFFGFDVLKWMKGLLYKLPPNAFVLRLQEETEMNGDELNVYNIHEVNNTHLVLPKAEPAAGGQSVIVHSESPESSSSSSNNGSGNTHPHVEKRHVCEICGKVCTS